jgi:hypothetical protein
MKKILTAILLAAMGATGVEAADTYQVRGILAKYNFLRPDTDDLTLYRLDWAPTLRQAREKAAREQRPIFLAVVTNSYGNVFTGHC